MNDKAMELVRRIAAMPLSSEDLHSTWNPPDWEIVVEWWDNAVNEARTISSNTYRKALRKEYTRIDAGTGRVKPLSDKD